MASAAGLDENVLKFEVGERSLGLPAAIVREIVPLPRLARVPHSPEVMLGVANMRGAVIPVISVARLLGDDDPTLRRVIVIDLDGPVGLAVTSASEILAAKDSGAVEQVDFADLIAKAMPERRGKRSGSHLTVVDRLANSVADRIPLLTFVASGQDFALPLSAVDEVLRIPHAVAQLPHADPTDVGSIAYRGTVLPLLSLSALLALPVTPVTSQSRIVVVRIGANRVGIVVDTMQAVASVAESEIDSVPDAFNRGGGEARIQAICRMAGGTRLLSVLAPEHLLRADITARLLGKQADAGEAEIVEAETASQFLRFTIGYQCFALPIEAVEEVVRVPSRLTQLPNAPDFVRGIMNLRGNAIPVIDQAMRFGATASDTAGARVIVVRVDHVVAGFVVDGASQIVRIADGDLHAAHEIGAQGAGDFDRVTGTDDDDAPFLVIGPRDLLDRTRRDLLAAFGKEGEIGKP